MSTGLNAQFEQAYAGQPAWDINRPQPAIVSLAERGLVRGDVLDVGCGTGETGLFLAARGYRVRGLDVAGNAIDRARQKAAARQLAVDFSVGSAFALDQLGRRFDTVVEVGLFHVFDAPERQALVAGIRRALNPGGRYAFLCFSDAQPGKMPPFRISRAMIDEALAEGWAIELVEAAGYETNATYGTAAAWLVVARKA